MSKASVRARQRWGWWSAAVLVLGSAACSVILDRNASQCQTDADCAKFGNHPYCRAGVCVSSGLGPAACTYLAPEQTPQEPGDFLNQCSQAVCIPFDDCAHLGVCTDAGPSLAAPPQSDASASPGSAFDAGSLPNCMDATAGRGNVVFISGASTWPPLIQKLAGLVIGAGGPVPVFQTTSSCAAVQAVFNGTPMVDPSPGAPQSEYATYFQADGSQMPCLLGPRGVPIDVGASDIFATSCGYASDAGTTNDTTGAIQAMAFIVPSDSTQTAISAEAAREVFGSGGHDGGARPWTDPTRYFVRNAGTGSQQMVGRAVGVPPSQFWGVDQGTATRLVNAIKLLTMTSAEPAIGFVSVDTYDSNRGNVNALAFKDWGQDCAYLPDSTVLSKDKQNVRDGHYPIWGPIHFLTSYPATAAATAFLNIVAVPNPPPNVDPIKIADAFIDSSLVPTCAMSVQRDTELGPLSAYQPPVPCGCYFDSKKGVPSPNCVSCDATRPCPADRPACNLGYCEVR